MIKIDPFSAVNIMRQLAAGSFFIAVVGGAMLPTLLKRVMELQELEQAARRRRVWRVVVISALMGGGAAYLFVITFAEYLKLISR